MGNEVVDEEARKAARLGSSPAESIPRFLRKNLPLSKTTTKHKEMTKIRTQQENIIWQSHRLFRIKQVDSSMPSDYYLKIVRVLKRNQGATPTQLRKGHIPWEI